MQPLACQLMRLSLHANGGPKFACRVVGSPVSRVTSQSGHLSVGSPVRVVTADPRQALQDGCFSSTACLVLHDVQARARSQQLALHARARAILAPKSASAEGSQQAKELVLPAFLLAVLSVLPCMDLLNVSLLTASSLSLFAFRVCRLYCAAASAV